MPQLKTLDMAHLDLQVTSLGAVLLAFTQLERLHFDYDSAHMLACAVTLTTAAIQHLLFTALLLEVDADRRP